MKILCGMLRFLHSKFHFSQYFFIFEFILEKKNKKGQQHPGQNPPKKTYFDRYLNKLSNAINLNVVTAK